MTKYEIKTDSFEFRFTCPVPAMSAAEILETYLSCDDRITSNSLDPALRASFDSEDEARAEFAKNYADYGQTYERRNGAFRLLVGHIAWLEVNEYDEDGEFDQGGEILAYSADPFDGDEEA